MKIYCSIGKYNTKNDISNVENGSIESIGLLVLGNEDLKYLQVSSAATRLVRSSLFCSHRITTREIRVCLST